MRSEWYPGPLAVVALYQGRCCREKKYVRLHLECPGGCGVLVYAYRCKPTTCMGYVYVYKKHIAMHMGKIAHL